MSDPVAAEVPIKNRGVMKWLLVGFSVFAAIGLTVAGLIAYFFGPEIMAKAKEAQAEVAKILVAQTALQEAYPDHRVQVSVHTFNGERVVIVTFVNSSSAELEPPARQRFAVEAATIACQAYEDCNRAAQVNVGFITTAGTNNVRINSRSADYSFPPAALLDGTQNGDGD